MYVTDNDLVAALRCASELLDRRRLQGIPIPGWLASHYHRMQHMSARGHQTVSAEQQLDEPLTTEEVAAMLHTSSRHVRRHAEQLGGIKIGRDWMFNRDSVQQHTQGGDE